ncbi:MAG TPA: hypothetical protein VF008_28860, partial [Niastella sp.]
VVSISGTAEQSTNNAQVGCWNTLGDFSKWGVNNFAGYAKIAGDDADIYICGGEYANHSNAMYWHNGNPVSLTDGSVESWAVDIKVVH